MTIKNIVYHVANECFGNDITQEEADYCRAVFLMAIKGEYPEAEVQVIDGDGYDRIESDGTLVDNSYDEVDDVREFLAGLW